MVNIRIETLLVLVLISAMLWSCGEKYKAVDSISYQSEELKVYNQLLDVALDSIRAANVNQNTLRQVSYMSDTLTALKNKFLNTWLVKRKFGMESMTNNGLHRFLKIGDTLRLLNGEIFSGNWLTLSRVSFNENFDRGEFGIHVWCGDLCGSVYNIEIEKRSGEWHVTKLVLIAIS